MSRSPHRLVPATLAAALAVVAASLGACSTEGAASRSTTSSTSGTTAATTATAPPATTTTTVTLPPPVPVAWEACGDGFECARTPVPVDYQDPSGPTLEVALVKRPAGSPEQRIGTLLVNPGGPGASGVRRVQRGFTITPEVADRFDIVGFDPRGVGESSPVACGSAVAAFRQTDLDPDDEEEANQLDAAARAVAEECATAEGERLAHLGTVAVAHDVEVIRRNLGEAQISFVGLSYASLIGLLWADAHPSSVRAMVLDGVVDPAAAGDATALAQVEVIDRSFQAMDDACAADPGCPLTAVGRRLSEAYDELAARVEAGEGRAAGVGPTQLGYAVFSATYGEERWPLLWAAIAHGLDGDLSGVADLAAWFTGLVEYVPFALVTCLDSPHPRGFAAWQRDAARAADASPRFGAIAANELLPCAYWPAATRVPAPVTAAGAAPILVIGTTGDVATPFRQAEAVADALRSGVLLRVEAEGHVAIGSDLCVDEAVTRYLVDLAPPAPPATC
jgi:pimeloyl-ACP methyl ester carboxylesterase